MGFSYPLKELALPSSLLVNKTVVDFIWEHGQWNKEMLGEVLPSNVVSQICKLYIPGNVTQDTLVWGLTSDGEYSVRTGARSTQGDLMIIMKMLNLNGFGN